MLDASLTLALRTHLERLVRPVELVADLDDSDAARQMRDLLGELLTLSPKLSLVSRRLGDDGPRPAFTVGPRGEPARVRFAGVPLGHEFTSLVLALLHAGGHPPKAGARSLERIAGLEGEHHFETFVSLSCQNCPDVVQALNLIATLNPRIRHTMIDGALHAAEVERRQILAVPSVYLDGAPFGQGRMGLEEILDRLDGSGAAEASAPLSAAAPYDVLVLGGGPAGAAAAVYAARKGVRTALVAERLGGQLQDTLAIENFLSVPSTEGPRLAGGLEAHVRAYDVEVIDRQRARALKPGALLEVELDSGATLKARAVVLATGARWRELGVPGEREYRNRGVAYCPHCDGPLFKGRRVAVVGGGNSGVEAAIDLAGLVAQVTLIEYEPALRADAVLVRRLRSLPNVTVLTDARTTEIEGDGSRVVALHAVERASGRALRVEVAGVFVQIGLVPNTDWLRDTLRLSARGEIEVDAQGRTSVDGVYAAGDCTTSPYKQIVIALGSGATAALGAFDHLIRQPLASAA